jgi:hypothetical protein
MNMPTACKVVTPECFYRGSTLLTTTLSSLSKGRGGQCEDPPGFPPFETLRAVSIVERLKACGNDGLLETRKWLQATICRS